MGASGSRAVRRNQAAAASVSDNLANLPATSAVRRDAVERVAFAEERLRQEAELNAKSLDEVSSEDTEMAAAMGAVMQVPDGAIHYKDHIIPLLDESEQNREMVRKVRAPAAPVSVMQLPVLVQIQPLVLACNCMHLTPS